MHRTENLNIIRFRPLITPAQLKKEFPLTDEMSNVVAEGREIIGKILMNEDSRRLVITGPCSLHDRSSSLEYAGRIKKLQAEVADEAVLVMRAYFEKPRTTIGWKGMLYDPYLDDSYDIEEGIKRARSIMSAIVELGLPVATEILDPVIPQYLSDLVSWAAIGARTTESQIHRQMASGLSMPIGFKNSTDGSLKGAINAIKACRSAHCFMGIDENGQTVIAETKGNKYGHIVMRGGNTGPNYESEFIAFAEVLLKKAAINTGIIVDCSHDNSRKDHRLQREVFFDVVEQLRTGSSRIAGVMLESFLKEGNQPVDVPEKIDYGISLTDKCVGWKETERLVRHLAGKQSS